MGVDIVDELMGSAHAVLDSLPKDAVVSSEGILLKKIGFDEKGNQVFGICTNSKPLAISRLIPAGEKDILEVEIDDRVNAFSDKERGEVFGMAINGQGGANIIISTKHK